ncbi:MAG: class I SAM-dependent methyltransferase [Chlamydiota bacterium]
MNGIFSPHLQLAKQYWQAHLKPGNIAIDATCGNGHDTLFLSQLLLQDSRSLVIGLDIQRAALQNTETLLGKTLSPDQIKQVSLFLLSHAEIETVPLTSSPDLIVYNLGYLPKGDKSITTVAETTLISIQKSLTLLSNEGALSITCYPGHVEGEKEERELLRFVETLSSHEWLVCYHKWPNRPRSPTLLWIQKVNGS